MDTGHAAFVAEEIRTTIAVTSVPGVDCHIAVSQGIATVRRHAGEADQLLRSTDGGLYTANTNGRTRSETAVGASRPDRTPIGA